MSAACPTSMFVCLIIFIIIVYHCTPKCEFGAFELVLVGVTCHDPLSGTLIIKPVKPDTKNSKKIVFF